jgi:hypothetical protein
MAKLTDTQLAWLGEIAEPTGDYPFPPANTVRALIRRGLVEPYRDPNDVFQRMTGAVALKATAAGRAALKETLG